MIINPHFPSLRSDPMALSGASRRKQTPCSLLTWVCLGSLFLIAASAPAFGGLTLTLNEEARTYTLSGSATGIAVDNSFGDGGGEIMWDNFAAGNWNNSESLLTSTDFTVSGNTLKAPPASQGVTIYDTGNVSGLLQLNNAGTITLTGTAQVNSYSTFRTDIQAHLINLARTSGGGKVPTMLGSSAFELLITSTFDPTPRGALYVNVNTTTKTYYVSGSATGIAGDNSFGDGGGEITWDNFAAGNWNNSESLLTSEAFTVGGNVLKAPPASQGVTIYDTGNVSGLLQLHVAVDTTLTGNTAKVYDYSGFDSGIASHLELMAANGDTLPTMLGGSQFGLQFVSVPEPSTWMMFASALAIGCGRRRRTMPDTFQAAA